VQLKKSDKIFVAGHRGMVGSALVQRFEVEGFTNLLTRDRSRLDLCNESAVTEFFAEERPDIVILAAAKVGGIKANNGYPVEFLLENLRIQNNVKPKPGNCSYSVAPVFIRSWHRNRFRKTRY
jgi:GDP-L-fucose synthase